MLHWLRERFHTLDDNALREHERTVVDKLRASYRNSEWHDANTEIIVIEAMLDHMADHRQVRRRWTNGENLIASPRRTGSVNRDDARRIAAQTTSGSDRHLGDSTAAIITNEPTGFPLGPRTVARRQF